MKALVIFIACLLLSACGQDRVHTEVKEICSSDNPPLQMPDEVVCDHDDYDTISVDMKKKKYICTRVWEDPGTIEVQ